MIWIGILLWISGVVGCSILSITTQTLHIVPCPLFPIGFVANFILLIIITPIVEEFLFRSWALGKPVFNIVISASLSGFFYFIFGKWYLSASLLVAILLMAFLLKDKVRFICLSIITSLLFAYMHIYSIDKITLEIVFVSFQFVGLAILCCWLVYNKGLLYAIGLHSLINLLSFAMMMIPTTTTIGKDSYSITPLFENSYAVKEEVADGIIYRGQLPLVAAIMATDQLLDDKIDFTRCNVFYRLKIEKVNIPVKLYIKKQSENEKIDRIAILKTIQDGGLLKSDTTYEPLIFMELHNNNLLLQPHQGDSTTIGQVVRDLQIHYKIPVNISSSLNGNCQILFPFEKFQTDSLNEIKEYLSNEYGLELWESNHAYAQIITFHNG